MTLLVSLASAQQKNNNDEATRQPSIFLGGTFSSNIARTSIDAYANDQLCGVFTNGSGSHFSFKGGYESPINYTFSLIASVGFRNLSSSFSTKPFNLEQAYDVSSNSLTTIDRERLYDVSMNAMGLGGGIAFHPFERVTVSGEVAGYFIPSSSYEQTEHLITPTVYYLDTKLSTRPVASGSFPVHRFFAALELGGGYDVPLSERMTLRPYIEGFIGLTPLASINGVAYRSYSISGGAALAYNFAPKEIEPVKEITIPPPPKPEAVPARPAALRLTVRAVGLTDHDEEVPQPIVAIENVLVTDVSPTLGYVFFDDGSSTISSRYYQYASAADVKNFSMKEFYKLDALGINHELLNVLGKRLTDHPKTNITLTGTRSTQSHGDSAASEMIALERAEHVAEYLQKVWQVAPSRIKVRSRSLPEMNSDDRTASGQAENRRVEVTASNRDILEPVETKRLEQTATPPRIKFYQDIYGGTGLKSNKITIRQGGRVIETRDQMVGETRSEWLWNIAQGNALNSDDTVTWTMEIADSSGQSSTVSGIIRIKPQEKTRVVHARDTIDADKSLERFHLLLFDYSSSSELGQNSEEVLNKLAASITPDARVTVTGHTDITGDPAFNEKLSYDRASRASILLSNKLRQFGKNVPSLELEARGSKDLLFDNSVAEGRMLSRTVRVTIERDLK